MAHPILITGASGHLGGGVLDHLLDTVPAERLIAFARDPRKVDRFAAKGVTVRPGDLNDPVSLDQAFAGVHTLLLVPTLEVGTTRTVQSRHAVEAAKRAGVQHILYAGMIHHDETGHGPIISDHQEAERQIAASGIPHTFIRNGIYLDVLPMLLGNAAESGSFMYPTAPQGVTFALRADLAEATARIIGTPALHGGIVPLGVAPVTCAAVAESLSNVLGRPVSHVDASLADRRAALLQHGLGEQLATVYTDMARAMAEGVIREPSTKLRELLGREPVGVETFLRTAFTGVHA